MNNNRRQEHRHPKAVLLGMLSIVAKKAMN